MADERRDAVASEPPIPWRRRLVAGLHEAVTLASAVWLLCFVVLSGVAVWFNADGHASCPVTAVPERTTAGEAVDGAALPVLEPTAERPAIVPLGRARAIRSANTSLTVTAVPTDEVPGAGADAGADQVSGSTSVGTSPLDDVDAPLPLEVRVNPFVRDDGATLWRGRSAQLVMAHAFSRRGTVVVELCVDRDGIAIGHPGRYEGSVTIVDPQVAPTDVPFVVTMAYPNAALVALLTVVAVAIAAMYSWRVHSDDGGAADAAIDLYCFFAWLRTWTGLLAVATGSIAAYVAYSATYLSNAVWGTSVTQFTAIVGAVFTAFVTASTTVIAGSRQRQRPAPDAPATAGPTTGAAPGDR